MFGFLDRCTLVIMMVNARALTLQKHDISGLQKQYREQLRKLSGLCSIGATF